MKGQVRQFPESRSGRARRRPRATQPEARTAHEEREEPGRRDEKGRGEAPRPPSAPGWQPMARDARAAREAAPGAEIPASAEPPAEAGGEDADVSESPPLDRMVHAGMGRFTYGISPASLLQAYSDWALHLSMAPGKQAQLVQKAVRKATRFGIYAARAASDPQCPHCIEPLAHDKRFTHPDWQQPPFNFIYQSFLLTQQWWHNATTGVAGVSRHHEDVVEFATRQLLDVVAPSNLIATNPEILKATVEQGGMNLYRGALNLVEDWERAVVGKKPVGTEDYRPGEAVAVTPGKVVYRNRLMELIQYAPTNDEVHAEPVLIVPAWIMKYYILDLSPHNSLVRYLVDKGHTVFMVSWKNPDARDRDLSMNDYMRLGVYSAVDAINAIFPERQIHGVGYCLGGTLMAMAAAAMARDERDVFKTLTLLAAQTDFTEAGELMLFIDESEITFLEDMMWEQGYLDTRQMAGAFQLLRSNDLIWSRMVHEYLLGERQPMFDLMAWNADATRMPQRMHSQYLRDLFLNNDLAGGRFEVFGRPIAISDIRTPIFSVSTVKDHVAPWRSVYKIHLLADAEVTFLLTTGGHNAGIVSEPGHPRRSYQVATRQADAPYIDPDRWWAETPHRKGSWWPEWQGWLEAHSEGRLPAPGPGNPEAGYRPIADAPGTYVLQD